MADTKTITAKITLGVPCPKKSVPLKKKDDRGNVTTVAGEYEHVELKHVAPGTPVTIDAEEADALIARGFADEVKPDAKAKVAA